MYSHLSVIGAAEFQSYKMGSQSIIIVLIISHSDTVLSICKVFPYAIHFCVNSHACANGNLLSPFYR